MAAPALVALVVGCGGEAQPGPDAGASTRPPRESAPSCAQPGHAPFRADDGGRRCAPVGATTTPSAGEWPDVRDAVEPVVYVRAGSTAARGTRDAPFGDLAAALRAAPPARTVALARGAHALTAPLSLDRSVTLVGASAPDTRIVAPPGMAALTAQATTSPVVVTLVGLTVRYESPSGAASPAALAVAGELASLRLRDVAVEQPGRGVAASERATVCAERLTVTGAAGAGVQLQGGAHGYLRNVSVRDCGGAGVAAGRAHVALYDSLVAGNRYDGVSIVGSNASGACRTDAECASSPACEDFMPGVTHARACVAESVDGAAPSLCASVHELRGVVLLGNAVTGLRAQRARPTDAEVAAGMRDAAFRMPGPVVRVARAVVAGTRAPSDGAAGGDGVYVGPGAKLTLDMEAPMSRDMAGRLSEIVANERAGMLVDGDATTDMSVPNVWRVGAQMDARGVRVVSNRGPGVFVQNRSRVERFDLSVLDDNAALGFGLTTGSSVAFFQDDQFINTRAATLALVTGTSTVRVTVGDGVSLGNPARDAFFQDDQFIGNERVGLLIAGGTARLMGGNTGARNGYGVAALDDATVVGASAAITGAVAVAPRTLAYVRDSLASALTQR